MVGHSCQQSGTHPEEESVSESTNRYCIHGAICDENVKGKDEWTVTSVRIHRVHDVVSSEVTRRDSAIETSTNGESVTNAWKNVKTTDKIDHSTSEQLRAPQLDEWYALSLQ